MMLETNIAIQGQRQSWNLIKKLGEGDAGEVYLAESVLNKQAAIVKRPRRGAFFSDILRQANQIKTEASILHSLQRITFPDNILKLKTPTLIDQNKPEFDLSEQAFIVIDQARGLDLKQLSQLIRFGSASLSPIPENQEFDSITRQWLRYREFPAPLLVRVLLSLLYFLQTIHTAESRDELGSHAGIIWNDVKPNHLYWYAQGERVSIIDWGNGQFLESDGVTKSRQFNATDDFRQYVEEMGNFLSEVNPSLHSTLEWPEDLQNNVDYAQAVMEIKEKLETQYRIHTDQLKALRDKEEEYQRISRPDLEQISQYEALQEQLLIYGELPDLSGATNFINKAAYQLVAEDKLDKFLKVCESGSRLTYRYSEKWESLSQIAIIAQQIAGSDKSSPPEFINALTAGVAEDWTAALWELFTYLGDCTRPEWWEKISQQIRSVCLGLDPESITPYMLFARLYYTMQAEQVRKGNQRLEEVTVGKGAQSQNLEDFHWQANIELLNLVNEEIIKKWKEFEPSPPFSGISYTVVDSLIDTIEELYPGWRDKLEKCLVQPKAQVDLVLKAWDAKDFELARRGLSSILIWDPDRTRLLRAEKAVEAAPSWLARIHKGASKDEPFYDYLTSVELAGRSLRNQVGPARWLDDTLEACKRLRKGTRSVDLLIEYPEIMQELPWLSEYQSREIVSLPHTRRLTLGRDLPRHSPARVSEGVLEGKFGQGQKMVLAEALDTWRPEARGSSARVFSGRLNNLSKHPLSLAFKIMRPDQIDYALPLFIEESQILTMLHDVPGITPLVELGFLKLDEGQVLPSDDSHASADQLTGQIIHYGTEQAQNFLASMDRQLALGWLPYLALTQRNPEHNLLHYCDASYTHGWFLPLPDSLVLALQICDILQYAHDRNIVYRDHKLLHYYWDVASHGVAMIDWNIAKRHSAGLPEAEIRFDLVQLGARGLHHIFTGRPAQGSLPLGPNRPEDIEKASTHYPVNWTYDDERLPNPLRTVLERMLNQGYTQVAEVKTDLLAIYQQLHGT
jgi:serine/threonine protein kinase